MIYQITNIQLIGLNNLISKDLQELQQQVKIATEASQQLASTDTKSNKEDLLAQADTLLVKDRNDTEATLTRLLKQIQPFLRKFSLTQRKIRITHALTKDSKDPKSPLLVDDKGNLQYSIDGQIGLETDLDDLNYKEVEFETDLDVTSPIVTDYSYLKDLIEGKLF